MPRGAHSVGVGARRLGRRRRERGFTLVELMVVVTVIGILAATAAVFVTPSSYAATARRYSDQVAALLDTARQRAIASRTYQKIEITADEIIHWQGNSTGMSPPSEWSFVSALAVPSDVVIASTSSRTHVNPDKDVPEVGVGLPADIDLAPDGSATSATVFITNTKDTSRSRVAVFRATGSAYAYEEW